MTLSVEIALMWSTVMVYAASSVLYATGTVFARPRILNAGLWTAIAGLSVHAAGFGIRWVRVGHAPFLGFYEVVAAYAFATVAVLVAFSLYRSQFRSLGAVMMPVALLALGASMLADKTDELSGGALASWWLTVHVMFAKLAYSSFIIAFALAVVYLMRDGVRGGGSARPILDKLPPQDVVDELAFRAASIGLLFLAIMIAAGAIWANEAWGRYWGWDPIETWSLVTWLVYAVYVHVRLTLGWRERKSAWILVAALPIVAFSFVVVPIVYNSIHGAYLRGL